MAQISKENKEWISSYYSCGNKNRSRDIFVSNPVKSRALSTSTNLKKDKEWISGYYLCGKKN